MIGLLMDGIVLGGIIAMCAVSLSMVYGVLNFANLAHGDLLALGAYSGLLANQMLEIGIIESIMVAIVISLGFGVLLEKILWKPLRNQGAGLITFLIVSMGLALAIRNSMTAIFGGGHHYYNIPTQSQLSFLGLNIGNYSLILIFVSIISMILIHYLLQETTMGKSMRALSDNKRLAKISGIEVNKVILKMWIIVTILTAVGGVLYGIVTTVRPGMGFSLLLPLFAATILGGIGNVYGAMLSGFIIGISMNLSTIILPTEYRVAIPFVVLILVLIFKPKGLFRGLR